MPENIKTYPEDPDLEQLPPTQNRPVSDEDESTDWIIVDGTIASGETPEEMESSRRLEERTKLIAPALDNYYGERDFSEAHVPKKIAGWSQKEQLDYLKDRQKDGMSALSFAIASGEWSDDELAAISKRLLAIADVLSPDEKDPWRLSAIADTIKSPEDLEITLQFAEQWRARIMSGMDAKDANRSLSKFTRACDILCGYKQLPQRLLDRETRIAIFANAMDTYEIFSDYNETHNDKSVSRFFGTSWEAVIGNTASLERPDHLTNLNTTLKAALQEEPDVAERLFIAARRYGRSHPLDAAKADAIITNVYPKIKADDPSVEPLLKHSNANGMFEGDFGIADFYIESLVLEASPTTINTLMMALYEIPTSDYSRFEENRKDALHLAYLFGGVRDMIHDQRPKVHDLIAAMTQYCRDGLIEKLEMAVNHAQRAQKSRFPLPRGLLLDPSRYEEKVRASYGRPEEPVIDVLERLEKNTRPVDEIPPKVVDAGLQQSMAGIYAASSDQKIAAMAAGTRYANNQLTKMYHDHTVGIQPSTIVGLAWLEREQFKLIQGLSYEDQFGLAKEEWFIDVLKFHELTNNVAYEEQEFEAFADGLRSMGDTTAFRAIAGRVIGQTQQLSELYKAQGKELWSEASWSGNVTHELIGLVDPREPALAIGRRLLVRAQRDNASYVTAHTPLPARAVRIKL